MKTPPKPSSPYSIHFADPEREYLDRACGEIYAVSRGTRCKQFMFSVSLNPPDNESVPVEYFEKALGDIEKDLGLEGQPRAIVFHEKEGVPRQSL